MRHKRYTRETDPLNQGAEDDDDEEQQNENDNDEEEEEEAEQPSSAAAKRGAAAAAASSGKSSKRAADRANGSGGRRAGAAEDAGTEPAAGRYALRKRKPGRLTVVDDSDEYEEDGDEDDEDDGYVAQRRDAGSESEASDGRDDDDDEDEEDSGRRRRRGSKGAAEKASKRRYGQKLFYHKVTKPRQPGRDATAKEARLTEFAQEAEAAGGGGGSAAAAAAAGGGGGAGATAASTAIVPAPIPEGIMRERHRSGFIPTIVNLVATVNLSSPLDLRHIALHARNAEYNPKRFSAVIMRVREPHTTALIFSSGKMIVTGAKSEEDAFTAGKKYAKIIQKLDHPDVKFREFKVQNIVATCDVKFPIRLETLAVHTPKESTYEPELFPGLVFRMKEPRAVILIFVSGKVVLTGVKMREHTYQAFEQIFALLKSYRKA